MDDEEVEVKEKDKDLPKPVLWFLVAVGSIIGAAIVLGLLGALVKFVQILYGWVF